MEERILELPPSGGAAEEGEQPPPSPQEDGADLFELLNSARGKQALAELIGATTGNEGLCPQRRILGRCEITGLAGSAQLGRAASKEIARASFLAYLDGTPLGKEIKDFRGKVNYGLMIASGFNWKNQGTADESLRLACGAPSCHPSRMAISVTHKRDLTPEQLAKIKVMSALETMLLDVPFVSQAQLKFLGRTIMSTISQGSRRTCEVARR